MIGTIFWMFLIYQKLGVWLCFVYSLSFYFFWFPNEWHLKYGVRDLCLKYVLMLLTLRDLLGALLLFVFYQLVSLLGFQMSVVLTSELRDLCPK